MSTGQAMGERREGVVAAATLGGKVRTILRRTWGEQGFAGEVRPGLGINSTKN